MGGIAKKYGVGYPYHRKMKRLSVYPEVPAKSIETKHQKRNAVRLPALGLLLLLLALILAGCSAKKYSGHGDLTGEEEQEFAAGTIYLPSGERIELNDAEKKAILGSGMVDSGISGENLQMVLPHFSYYVHQGHQTAENILDRGRPYLPYMREIFRKKGLPEELVWLAFVESGYNPLARSRSGAVGIWQFMPSTGRHYGLRQDWWVDERRDPWQSTVAAADYLAKLYGDFKDWPLAITAYNAGEGKISRALAASGTKNFFDLCRSNDKIYSSRDRLSDENRAYYPRFVAVCRMMRHAESLGFAKTTNTTASNIVKLQIRPGTDLKELARASGMEWAEFVALNPANLRTISHPGCISPGYVPAAAADKARAFLSRSHKTGKSQGWAEYTVAKGDTLSGISVRTGVPVAELRRVNKIQTPLRIGTKLRIPASGDTDGTAESAGAAAAATAAPVQKAAAPVKKTAVSTHEVARGESLYGIARKYGVQEAELRRINGLKDNKILAGQTLKLPVAEKNAPAAGKGDDVQKALAEFENRAGKGGEAKKASPAVKKEAANASEKKKSSASAARKIVTYRVQAGEYIWAIARKFNMSPQKLLSLNNMDQSSQVRPGDILKVEQQN